jgi:ABC-type Zn2+ transport system substrate-binding protein/surface adhesin
MSLPDVSALRDFFLGLHFEAYSEHNVHHHDNIADDAVTHEHTHKHGEDGEEHQHDHDHFSYKVSELRIVLNLSIAIEPIVGFNILSGFRIDRLNSHHHPQELLRPPIA